MFICCCLQSNNNTTCSSAVVYSLTAQNIHLLLLSTVNNCVTIFTCWNPKFFNCGLKWTVSWDFRRKLYSSELFQVPLKRYHCTIWIFCWIFCWIFTEFIEFKINSSVDTYVSPGSQSTKICSWKKWHTWNKYCLYLWVAVLTIRIFFLTFVPLKRVCKKMLQRISIKFKYLSIKIILRCLFKRRNFIFKNLTWKISRDYIFTSEAYQ